MHKLSILLVKADNKEEAEKKANEFLESYEWHVWDWYEIGGRRKWTFGWETIEELGKCIDLVKKWMFTEGQIVANANKYSQKIKKLSKNPNAWYDAWREAKRLWNLLCKSFSWEYVVYDVERGSANRIPEKTDWYYAVVVDLHN